MWRNIWWSWSPSRLDAAGIPVPATRWAVDGPVLAEAGGTLIGPYGEPFGYRDGYEHPGLIAADTPQRAAQVAAWFGKA